LGPEACRGVRGAFCAEDRGADGDALDPQFEQQRQRAAVMPPIANSGTLAEAAASAMSSRGRPSA